MWDESLIESKRSRTGKKKWFTFPAAIVFHAVILFALIVASFWKLEAVPPAKRLVDAVYVAILPSGPPPGSIVKRPSGSSEIKPPKPARPGKVVQIPEQIVPVEDLENPEPVSGEVVGETTEGESGNEFVIGGYHDGTGRNGVLGFDQGQGELPIQTIETVSELPVLLKRVEPEYPYSARRLRIQGILILQAVITKEGNVNAVTLLQSAHPLLDEAAIQAVQQWKYRPATLAGRPVSVYFKITVKFSLR